jgi:hypothetical protein
MMKIYLMFAVVGWIWAAIVFAAMGVVWLRRRQQKVAARPGFEVVESNEEQH